MMRQYIPHAQLARLARSVAPNRVVVVYGPRRVGKTTLLQHFMRQHDPDALFVSGEDMDARGFLESQSVSRLRTVVERRETLIVDEAQHVPQIGLTLKLLADHVEGLRIIATGSSSFDLAQQTGEPLTGRKRTLLLLPLAQLELMDGETAGETRAQLETRLIYGSYPEVVLMESTTEREIYLKELISSYLFKDILQLERVRHADKLQRLLQAVALQIGKEVSVTELGTGLGMSRNTVERYLDLLEKAYVLYGRLGFSRNLRKEIAKSRRYYFYDNGIRNGLINNFNSLARRDDVGALWENYVMVERLKYNLYTGRQVESRFWTTREGEEIDLVEERGGHLDGLEMKWSPHPGLRAPRAWREAYPESSFRVVDRENYLDFIAGDS